MYGIRNAMKKNTCVISLVMFYERRETNPTKWCRDLRCVLYYAIDKCVWIDYLFYQSKTVSAIYSDKMFASTGYNKLLGIGIPEL